MARFSAGSDSPSDAPGSHSLSSCWHACLGCLGGAACSPDRSSISPRGRSICRQSLTDDLKVTLIAAAQDQIIFFDLQFLELLDQGGSIHRKRRPLRAADALATCFPPTGRDRPASYFACKRSSPVCNLTLSGSATTSPNGPPSFSPEAHHGGCHPRTGNILHAACYHPPLRKADAGADDTVRLPSSLPFLRDDRDGRLPIAARAALLEMADQIDKLTDKVELLDAKIIAGVKADDAARRLTTIPGVGPIIAATVGSPFRIRRRPNRAGSGRLDRHHPQSELQRRQGTARQDLKARQ
ncbi:hypothetical protein HNR26_004693 [Rhizobium rosettiformans]|uniref:IS110 family transposase n=1 Tax=Rhizobium rosettiformans TaxID=1368430 RepID=A0A7W8MF59_9HYPH|nr:hypothetical protein [Rhizobium rosettiformans]